MKALVLFGSESDRHVYVPLLDGMKSRNIEFDFFIASAHKSPNLVDGILQKANTYGVIVAGAGLAAHLPGVVAARTIRPVIGIPVNSNFSGVDSLLSIVQMPPSVPVLGVGVDKSDEAAKAAGMILCWHSKINIVARDMPEKGILKMKEIFSRFGAKYFASDMAEKECVNIKPVLLKGKHGGKEGFAINIPVHADSTLDDIGYLTKLTENGVWVGLNRFENAAIAAVQIINLNNYYSAKLLDFKRELEGKFKNAQD